MGTSVRLRGVRAGYAGGRGRYASVLEELDLGVRAGRIAVLMGVSGSGKTTLLRVVAGLHAPEAGEVLFDQRVVTEVPPAGRNVGFAFQGSALYRGQTVRRNLELALTQVSTGKQHKARRIGELLEVLGIGDKAETRVERLSGGEQQRVGLARALIRQPGVLLLDEPMSNLDAARRTEILGFLRRHWVEQAPTVLLVTHDWEEAGLLAQDVGVLDGGRIVQFDTLHGIYQRPASVDVMALTMRGPLNKLPVERDGEAVGISCASGARLTLHAEGSLSARSSLVAFRPDALWASREGRVPLLIEEIRPYNGDMLIYGRIGPHAVYAMAHRAEPPEVGQIAHFDLRDSKVKLAEANGRIIDVRVRSLWRAR